MYILLWKRAKCWTRFCWPIPRMVMRRRTRRNIRWGIWMMRILLRKSNIFKAGIFCNSFYHIVIDTYLFPAVRLGNHNLNPFQKFLKKLAYSEMKLTWHGDKYGTRNLGSGVLYMCIYKVYGVIYPLWLELILEYMKNVVDGKLKVFPMKNKAWLPY